VGKSLTAGGEPRRLTLNVGELMWIAGSMAWMPDGKEILYSTGTRPLEGRNFRATPRRRESPSWARTG